VGQPHRRLPGTTDPKDAFIPIRRMFNWIGNTIILTTDANVDDPINRRLIDLGARHAARRSSTADRAGALVDGKIEFRADENPTTDLSDGKITWHVTLTPPSPGEEMTSRSSTTRRRSPRCSRNRRPPWR
jgi:phage tail sheath protein FI